MMKYQEHKNRWSTCQGCDLCKTRSSVVLFRKFQKNHGFKCDVLLIGEAPGDSEDMTGLPFTGPSGHLLDSILQQSLNKFYEHPSMKGRFFDDDVLPNGIGFTNILACMPPGSDTTVRPPTVKEAESCRHRLVELINATTPRLVICVGDKSKTLIPFGFNKFLEHFHFVDHIDWIRHPAFLLRLPSSHQPTEVAKTRQRITNALITTFLSSES